MSNSRSSSTGSRGRGSSTGSGKVNWQSDLNSPGQRLASLLRSSKLADIAIIFPGYDKSIKAHRLVLAMSSPVFEAMLFGSLAEGPELRLHEDPPEAFEWILDYMYRGHTQLPGVKLTVQVYQLASKYQIDSLMRLCSEHLQSSLTPSNLPEMYDTAVLLEDAALLQKCLEVVHHSPSAVLSSPQFGLLSRGGLTHLLQQPLHIASEVVLVEALVNWGRAQNSSDSLREVIKDFLPMVRFLALTTDDFVQYVMPAGILTLEEISSILMNIKDLSVALPSICCQIKEKRLCYDDSLLRTITLTTAHHSGRSRKSARGSIFVHSSHEQILIMNMRTTTTLQLRRLESKALSPNSGTAVVSIKDGSGCTLETAECENHMVEFDEPIPIRPDTTHSITVRLEGHWPRGDMGDFSNTEKEIKLDGKIAYTEGRFGSVTLHFWSFN